jgi:hypothetical protein
VAVQQPAVKPCDKSITREDAGAGANPQDCVATKLKKPESTLRGTASIAKAAAPTTHVVASTVPHRPASPEAHALAATATATGARPSVRQKAKPAHSAPAELATNEVPAAPMAVTPAVSATPVTPRPSVPSEPAVAPVRSVTVTQSAPKTREQLQQQVAATCLYDLDHSHFGWYATLEECAADKLKRLERSRYATPVSTPSTIAVARAR